MIINITLRSLFLIGSLFLLQAVWSADLIQPATILKLSPRGVRFIIADKPGATLVTIHYNINKEIDGVKTTQYNFNIRTKTGNVWVHDNRFVDIKDGDEIYYWIYAVANNIGSYLINQKHVVGEQTTQAVSTRISESPDSNMTTPDTATARTRPADGDDDLSWNPVTPVLEDSFNYETINRNVWEPVVAMNEDFSVVTSAKENAFIKNGKLHIKPTLTADKYGEDFLKHGIWDLKKEFGYCFDPSEMTCRSDATKTGMLPPVMSALLKAKVPIKYGRIEIVAKMPKGDWLVPAFYLLPKYFKYGPWPRSGTIAMAEGRGNLDFGIYGIDYMQSALYWAPDTKDIDPMKTRAFTKAKSVNFAEGFHKYTLLWDKHGIETYVDGERFGQFLTPSDGYWKLGKFDGDNIWPNLDSPFDQEFELYLGMTVGGTNGLFPDGIYNAGYGKPWVNADSTSQAREKFWKAKNYWEATWYEDDSALQVESVYIYQLD